MEEFYKLKTNKQKQNFLKNKQTQKPGSEKCCQVGVHPRPSHSEMPGLEETHPSSTHELKALTERNGKRKYIIALLDRFTHKA